LVQQLVKAKPDITLAELRAKLKAHKIMVGQTSIFRFLNHLGLSYKKNGTRQRAKAA
jgi:transposase